MSQMFGSFNNLASVWIADEDKTNLWSASAGYSYQMRGQQFNRGGSNFFELWPSSHMSSGDPTSPLCLIGTDSGGSGKWSEWSISEGGHVAPLFISGTCKDAGGSPLSGVLVSAFRSSDNLYIGKTTSDSNGNYSVSSIYAGVNHYLVAYLPGSPDIAGTTVSTLVPV